MRDGLVVVDKPAGWTSHDVVGTAAQGLRAAPRRARGHARSRRDRRAARRPRARRRACCGSSRRPARRTAGAIVFGVADDTLDAAGDVLDQRADAARRATQVEHARRAFVGDIEQLPPMVSAVKVGGRRSTSSPARARRSSGRRAACASTASTSRSSSPVPYPEATFAVECSSGTYVRSLAADLGDRARRLRPPRRAAAAARRVVRARRGAPARRDRGRPRRARCSRRPTRCATSSASTSTPSRRAPSRTASTFAARALLAATTPATGPFARRRPRRRRCSRSTSGAARA